MKAPSLNQGVARIGLKRKLLVGCIYKQNMYKGGLVIEKSVEAEKQI